MIIDTACPDEIPLSSPDNRFVDVTITTSDLSTTTVDRDLHLANARSETFRGRIRDGKAHISGPLENYPDKPTTPGL